MTSIFLSYARGDDEPFVRRLYADLTKAGFDVWFDRVSMPSRQLTFHQEIRDAIASTDRLLLVVGRKAIESDYIMQEWRFAYFKAGKCVNPIVRLDDGALKDGYSLMPEDLRLLHAEDFRDDATYDLHLQNLIRQFSEEVAPVGKLVAVPELPAHFCEQPDRIKALRDILLIDLQKPVVVSSAAARVGLQGMGGIGKSMLASSLAQRPEVRRAFPDGIFWIKLGQEPKLAELQRWLARELGDEALFADLQSGKECLRKLLEGRKALLVLDDVWQREHAEAFNVIGPMCRILLTTRDAGLVTALASKESHYRVELPTKAEAEAIFAAAAHLEPGNWPPETREIVAQCGRLPLAVALCGGMVQANIPSGDVLEALREHDLEYLSSNHPAEDQHQNVWKAMDVSLRALPPEQRDRFAELAVFALDMGAPAAAVVTLWEHTAGLSPRHARQLLADFVARSLVQYSLSDTRLTLHDLLHNFAEGMAAKRFGSIAALHQRLLDAYAKKCPDGWPSGPDDGYFLQNLCGQLLAAGKTDDAVSLLSDIPWVETKSRTKLVFSLHDDYQCTIAAMPEVQVKLRQDRERQARLDRWAQESTEYSRQWSERRDQMNRGVVVHEPEPRLPSPPAACRMWTEEEIEEECLRVIKTPTRLDRLQAFASFVEQDCYVLLEFGTRPGFVVQHAFNYAPCGPVYEAAAGDLSIVAAPLLVRHWDATDRYNPKPALRRNLQGHVNQVAGVNLTSNGQRMVSASWDKTVRAWNLETGKCVRVLEGHTEKVVSVSVTPDGLRAVSGSYDKTVRVWDLETGACLRVLEGHTGLVESVSVTPDGLRAVSGSFDKTVRVWDLETGACLRVLVGHTAQVWSVSVTADGLRAVSGGSDDTVRVWDLETGTCLHLMEGHTAPVTSVSVTPNGQRAVSASCDKTVRVWDLQKGACLRVLEGATDRVTSVCTTADGLRAVSGSFDKTVRVWDLKTGACLRVLVGQTHGLQTVSVMADGQRAVSAGFDKTVRVLDLESGACSRVVVDGHTDWVRSVCVTSDGQRAVSASKDKAVRVWDLETGACLRVLVGHTDWVRSVSVAPGSQRAVSASWDKTVRVWNLESGKCVRVLEGHTDWVWSVCVTSDDHRAVSTSRDKTVRVWDLETGACSRVLEGHTDQVLSVCVPPDSLRVVSGSSDGTLRVWNLETGACLRVLEGHTGWVWSVCVTPDSLRVVSGSGDGTLRVWDLETGVCLRVLEGHTDQVTSVSVTADGLRAVSGGDRTVRVWDLETGACLAVARKPVQSGAVALCPVPGRLIFGAFPGGVIQFDLREMTLAAVSPGSK